MSTTLDWLLATSGPAGVVVGVVAAKFMNRSRDEAETRQADADKVHSFVESAVLLVAPLQEQITKLTSRVDALETENKETKTKLGSATAYIRTLLTWIGVQVPGQRPPLAPTALGL